MRRAHAAGMRAPQGREQPPSAAGARGLSPRAFRAKRRTHDVLTPTGSERVDVAVGGALDAVVERELVRAVDDDQPFRA
jgi:hypothetical protein